jgi:hypothetical protein
MNLSKANDSRQPFAKQPLACSGSKATRGHCVFGCGTTPQQHQ